MAERGIAMSRVNPNRYEDSTSRTAMLKSRIGVADVMSALMLDTDLGNQCPVDHCGAFAVVETKDGNGWRCTECGAKGDIFNLVMIKLDKTFPAARDWIEERVLPKRKDRKTGELPLIFGDGAPKRPGQRDSKR
jgi:hypothetical protein